MSVNSQKYIIQNIERVAFYDLATGACWFIADDLQEATMSNEQETVYALGKNGVKIGSADRNKASKITATNGSIVDGILASQIGNEVTTGKYTVRGFIDELTVTNGADSSHVAKLKYKAVGSVGNELKFIYRKNTDGSLGTKYAISSKADATHFAYSPATGTITCPTGVFQAGEKIIAIYDFETVSAKRLINEDNSYSSTGLLIADIYAKDMCTEQSYCGKIIFPKAKASGNFELSFGNDPSVQSMEFEALAGGCSSSSSHLLWEMFIFDEEDIATV